jgi:uncharacterized protein YggE
MRNEKLKLFGLGLLVLILGFAIWQGGLTFSFGRERIITVTGTGKVKMKPEVVRFTAGVQKFSENIDDALAQEKTATTAIVTVLKESGVKEEDIKTAYFSVWPQTSDYYENNLRRTKISGYQVSNTVEVKLGDINRISEILRKVIGAGANNVSGLSFGADNPTEQEFQAREKAIQDARQKAEKMARIAGKRLGPVVSITESYSPSPAYKLEGAGGGGGPTIESGGLEVTQTVTVVFSLR